MSRKGVAGNRGLNLSYPEWTYSITILRYTLGIRLSRILESIRQFLIPTRPVEFNEYVSYWAETAKDPRALSVSTDTVGSREWLALAEGQYQLLRWAGLRKDWVIVEIGFGNGKIPYMLKRENAIPNGAYYGFDIIQSAVEYCKKKFTPNNFHFNLVENNSLNIPKEFADCIFLFSVFTHVDEDTVRGYLKQIRRAMKPSGLCIFSIHLSPQGRPGQRTIPIAQYSFDEIRELVSSLGLCCYKFTKYPDLSSVEYVPTSKPDRPYGIQFVFVVSNTQLKNPELMRL